MQVGDGRDIDSALISRGDNVQRGRGNGSGRGNGFGRGTATIPVSHSACGGAASFATGANAAGMDGDSSNLNSGDSGAWQVVGRGRWGRGRGRERMVPHPLRLDSCKGMMII